MITQTINSSICPTCTRKVHPLFKPYIVYHHPPFCHIPWEKHTFVHRLFFESPHINLLNFNQIKIIEKLVLSIYFLNILYNYDF